MPKTNNYLVIILIMVLVFIAAFLTVSGVMNLKDTLNAIANERTVIEKLYEKALYLQQMKSSGQDYESVVDAYKMMIPHEPDKNHVLETVYGLAGNNAVNVNTVQFGEETKGQKIIKVPITINLDGDFVSIMNFLKNIRKQRRLYNIININLSRAGDQDSRIYANMLINAYYEK
ncbi:MAG: type 4a pilus biogenesis protein PilO [Clostridiaceae bacterium]|nr:type 4a pilus biogenesis protein PilO [Clostridiaceae bacterium]